MWYNKWAVSEGIAKRTKKFEKTCKKNKKVVDKLKCVWYNKQAVSERQTGPWKLNNEKEQKLVKESKRFFWEEEARPQ